MSLKRFGIFIKKDPGFERINEGIISALETKGWRANRNYTHEHILMIPSVSLNLYRKVEDLKAELKKTLSKLELSRITVNELPKPKVEEKK